jgi:hypothetical protein
VTPFLGVGPYLCEISGSTTGLERRCNGLMILMSWARILLQDVDVGPSDETLNTQVPFRSRHGT